MELYKEYIKERENAELEYNDKGFMSYKLEPNNGVFIMDAYVAPQHRKENVTREFLNNIVEKTNSKKIYTTTDINAINWELSEKVILALGFKKMNKVGTLNYYIKEIK